MSSFNKDKEEKIMNFLDIIIKKRDKGKLTKEEITFTIENYTKGNIPDYQMSSFLMAVFFNGMNREETFEFTHAMANSGKILDLSAIPGIKIDKHSTGGIGDVTTLILAPLVASCGVPVAKMSGRGLGRTGGTIDKLESIPGFKTEIDIKDFIEQVKDIGIAVVGQSGELAPADKKIYALRDVTGTVESIPLIASSIMSKKIALGSDGIVLEVTTGNGAFMEDIRSAKELAQIMVDIGKDAGKKMTAVLTSMEEPLGIAVGNALEVKEAIDALKGNIPEDVKELVLTLGSYMLYLAGKVDSPDKARTLLEDNLVNRRGLSKFREMIEYQGGDPSIIDYPEELPTASIVKAFEAKEGGYVKELIARYVGDAAHRLGAGRETKEDKIDLSVGIVLEKKIGDKVKKGDVLAWIHANSEEKLKIAEEYLNKAYKIGKEKVDRPKLILGIVE